MKAALLRIPRPLGLAEDRNMGGGGRTEEDVGESGRERLPGDADVVSSSQSCGPPLAGIQRGAREERGSYRALTERKQLFSVFMGISVCVFAIC